MPNRVVSWRALSGTTDRWSVAAVGGGNLQGENSAGHPQYLMQWGPSIQFQVQPLNYNEMDIETETDWAKKEIAGSAIYREWVGENDELLHLRGKLFPYRIGGMSQIESFDAQRRAGMANLLIRGDGAKLGWFVCEKLVRNHTWISFEGVGQQIAFEAIFARVPVPDPGSYLPTLWTAGALPGAT